MSIWPSLPPPPVHTSVLKKEIVYFGTYKYWPDKMWTKVRKRQMRQMRNTQWSVHLSLRAAVQTDGENIWWHEQEILTTKVFQKKQNIHDSLWSQHTRCMSDVKSSCVLTESLLCPVGQRNKHRLQCWRNCVLSLCFLPCSFSSCLWCCWWEELGSLVEHPVSWFWLSSLSPWWPRCPVCLLWELWQKQVQQRWDGG